MLQTSLEIEAAFRKIAEAKLVESSNEVMQHAAQKHAKTYDIPQLKIPAQVRK
jgi:hypothetical protein